MFYYAYVDSNYKVTGVYSLTTETTADGYIAITEEQYNNGNLVGKYYNPYTGNFDEPHEWVCNTTDVQYGSGNITLDEKLNAMDETIEGKADANHTHTNYAEVGHTHSDYVTNSTYTTGLSGKADVLHSHSEYATSEAMNTALNGKANSDHTHTQYAETTHTHSQDEITGLASALSGKANTSHTHAQSEVTGLSAALDGKAAVSHTHDVADVSGTLPIAKGGTGATTAAAALNNLGITATAAELNYVDGVTSNIQTQLNAKSDSSHNHDSAYIAKSLQMTADDGGVSLYWTDQDVVEKIKALGSGIHTAYAKGGTTNNPKTTESWRFIVHKTGSANFGWVMAFGANGSVYTGYVDSGTWKGWKCIYDASPAPLWSGAKYMHSPDSTPQVVTPSKKLSECRNGWLLLWSDYDADTTTANDADFVTTMIPKRNPSGGTWGGKVFLCDIPRYVGSDPDDPSTEKRIMKPIYVHDDCIKGSSQNASGTRNDVVLRAIYEW